MNLDSSYSLLFSSPKYKIDPISVVILKNLSLNEIENDKKWLTSQNNIDDWDYKP